MSYSLTLIIIYNKTFVKIPHMTHMVEKKWISEAITFIDAEILDLWRNVLSSVFSSHQFWSKIRRGRDLDGDFWVRLGEAFLGLCQIYAFLQLWFSTKYSFWFVQIWVKHFRVLNHCYTHDVVHTFIGHFFSKYTTFYCICLHWLKGYWILEGKW